VGVILFLVDRTDPKVAYVYALVDLYIAALNVTTKGDKPYMFLMSL